MVDPASNSRPLPQGHHEVPTNDGTPTLFSEAFGEACHSTAGARQETQLHYLEGCQVTDWFARLSTVRVLEVGFATGLGWRMTQELALNFPAKKLEFLSLEIDEGLIQWAEPRAQKSVHKGVVAYTYEEKNARLTVLAGDARHTLPAWHLHHPELRFHAFYQDAFSPKRNPTLWSVEWFEELGRWAEPAAILSTYSASVSIRKSLLAAGWGVRPGEKFGPKRTSTRAHWRSPSDPDILALLERSPTPALKDRP